VAGITGEVVINGPVERARPAIADPGEADPGEHVAWHPFVPRAGGEHALGAVGASSVLIGRKPATSQERSASDARARITWTVERAILAGLRQHVAV
jgi:hypothetical protein